MTDPINKIQFKLLLSRNQFLALLTSLKAKTVSITGLSLEPLDEGCLSVLRFVTNNVPITQQTLIELGLEFTTKTVLLLTVPSVPGALQVLFVKLYCYVRIIASYIDESLGQIVEFDNIELARRVLTEPLAACPEPIVPIISNPCNSDTLCYKPCIKRYSICPI